jgi:hypothetical protein
MSMPCPSGGKYNIHDAAAVIKCYLRSLPDPIVTVDVAPWMRAVNGDYAHLLACFGLLAACPLMLIFFFFFFWALVMTKQFKKSTALHGDSRRCKALRLSTRMLPVHHRHLCSYLFNFLARVHELSADNGMDASNLATVFCPNIFRAYGSADNTGNPGPAGAKGGNATCGEGVQVLMDMILWSDRIFGAVARKENIPPSSPKLQVTVPSQESLAADNRTIQARSPDEHSYGDDDDRRPAAASLDMDRNPASVTRGSTPESDEYGVEVTLVQADSPEPMLSSINVSDEAIGMIKDSRGADGKSEERFNEDRNSFYPNPVQLDLPPSRSGTARKSTLGTRPGSRQSTLSKRSRSDASSIHTCGSISSSAASSSASLASISKTSPAARSPRLPSEHPYHHSHHDTARSASSNSSSGASVRSLSNGPGQGRGASAGSGPASQAIDIPGATGPKSPALGMDRGASLRSEKSTASSSIPRRRSALGLGNITTMADATASLSFPGKSPLPLRPISAGPYPSSPMMSGRVSAPLSAGVAGTGAASASAGFVSKAHASSLTSSPRLGGAGLGMGMGVGAGARRDPVAAAADTVSTTTVVTTTTTTTFVTSSSSSSSGGSTCGSGGSRASTLSKRATVRSTAGTVGSNPGKQQPGVHPRMSATIRSTTTSTSSRSKKGSAAAGPHCASGASQTCSRAAATGPAKTEKDPSTQDPENTRLRITRLRDEMRRARDQLVCLLSKLKIRFFCMDTDFFFVFPNPMQRVCELRFEEERTRIAHIRDALSSRERELLQLVVQAVSFSLFFFLFGFFFFFRERPRLLTMPFSGGIHSAAAPRKELATGLIALDA